MTKRQLTKKQADALLAKHGDGNWKVRHDQIACAADTGDSGWADTYSKDGKDVLRIEYPNARYKAKVYAVE